MCRRGWNRGKFGYSIWRNVIGYKGLCKICLRRANKGLNSIPFPYENNEDENDEIEYCDCGMKFPEMGYCRFCGAHTRHL